MEARSNGSCSARSEKHKSRIAQDLPMSLNHVTVDEPTSKMHAVRRHLSSRRKPRVCIIGAGIAGLKAADVLLHGEAHVTVLEARDRIGGRVAHGQINGHVVDLGPNWIHGTDKNPILDLAAETGTAIHSWSGQQTVFDDNGSAVDEEQVEEVSDTFWGVIADAFKISNDSSESIPPEKSLFDFVKEKANQKYGDAPSRSKSLLLREAEMWGAFVGGQIQRQSLKFFWLEECLEGENPYVSGTYRKVLERVAEHAQAKADIKLKHKVTNIENLTVNGDIHIKASNGFSGHFDEVIITTPLGWLKRNHKSTFAPPLSESLSDAIGAVGYGNLDKCYITFPTAWWNTPPPSSVASPPTQELLPNTASTTQPINQPHPMQEEPTSYPGFTHWHRPNYAGSTNPNGWNLQALNLAAVTPASTAHPTLLYYFYGDCASHIASKSMSLSASDFQAFLVDFFKPYFALLPNYDPSNPECVPVATLATNWAADELAGYGSYCNFQVGLDAGDKHIEAMREGLPDRGIWFAGEHVAPFVALGTVTGAYWSGEAVARRILGAYDSDTKSDEAIGHAT